MTSVVTLVAAAAAALLGRWLLFADRPLWTTVAVVAGATAVAVLLATLLVRGPQRAEPEEYWSEPRARNPRPAPPPPAEPPLPLPAGPETVQVVLPVERPRTGQWWNQDAPAPAANRAIAAARPAPRDLAELRDSARVVQCPRCGAFRVDVAHTGAGFAFRCRVDDHAWTWRPGTAWPPTVVASRRRTSL
ncbi:hypothetical protein BJF78_11905 [Pseudonocardia sp. CNS-139]|nr:hypothetical protein BJF78_11905 [Pseudonocardia sp. CNS-139]